MPHVALLGPPNLLDRCAPGDRAELTSARIEGPPAGAHPADAVIAFEPSRDQWAALDEFGLPTLVWWHDVAPDWAAAANRPLPFEPRRTVTGSPQAPPGSWRSIALPVADALFADSPEPTERDSAIVVNFQGESGPASMHRALTALAQGKLLVSEPLVPSRGLEPGIDHVEAHTLDEVRAAVANATRAPESFLRMRLRGRRKAELFRSSRVVARLVDDLLLELDLAAAAS